MTGASAAFARVESSLSLELDLLRLFAFPPDETTLDTCVPSGPLVTEETFVNELPVRSLRSVEQEDFLDFGFSFCSRDVGRCNGGGNSIGVGSFIL